MVLFPEIGVNMEIICEVCKELKNTPYKNVCKKCYQNKWGKIIKIKECATCKKEINYGKELL